ncbi:hypothetical protein SAMN05421841_0642 [Chryseobacterium wanjuense]|uniref:Uncharacterized protein n=1 Tax=Chryseobacterium wanjuense TaxID=356305 RepID=A0A1I0NKB4_9FLAO|nr:hypothetical protein [Chryseobacterium wanjuense]SEW01743.1 hypothetical protein SAMN05421841_0642 [Chryseobacterium wanjuense]
MVILTSCNTNDDETILEGKQAAAVDRQGWTQTSVLLAGLNNPEDTSFMRSELNKLINFWGIPVQMMFVNDPVDPNGSMNAISYDNGSMIYYGYTFYNDAKSKAGNIGNVFILGHEYGHQIQYKFQLPQIITENTSRGIELEADGLSGYYLGRNQVSFQQVAIAANYAAAIGDFNITDPSHHGIPSQRRSAVRLGYLLSANALTPQQFDMYFKYYYFGVLNGQYKIKDNSSISIDPELDQNISKHLEEIQRIKNGEMSYEEYRNLK